MVTHIGGLDAVPDTVSICRISLQKLIISALPCRSLPLPILPKKAKPILLFKEVGAAG
ncbi:hypothetical protein ACNKHL_17690 [Shigella flexneri]